MIVHSSFAAALYVHSVDSMITENQFPTIAICARRLQSQWAFIYGPSSFAHGNQDQEAFCISFFSLLLSLFLAWYFFINSGDLLFHWLFHWRHLHTSIFQRKYYLKRSLLEYSLHRSFWLKTFKNFQCDFLLNSKFHTNLDKLQKFQMKLQPFFEKISLYLEYFFEF